MDKREFELLWRQRILIAAVNDQVLLVNGLEKTAYDPLPWENNVYRLRFRLKLTIDALERLQDE